jgi:hypothetical protein
VVDRQVCGRHSRAGSKLFFLSNIPDLLVDSRAIWCYNIHILKQKEFEMNEKSAMFLVITGLVMTMAGVGGVENSIETVDLLQSLAVSIVGLAVMGCGALAIRVQQNG